MNSLASEVEGTLLSAAVSLIILWIAYRKGAFASWQSVPLQAPPTFLLVFLAFAIYISVNLLLPIFLGHVFIRYLIQDRVMYATWLTFLTEAITLICLLFFLRSIYKPIALTIWKRNQYGSLKNNATAAFIACMIAFPITLFAGQFLELAVYFIFHTFQIPDQTVILFLKMTFGKPIYFFLATISIILFAPLIEELLFRGFLQTYFRRYCTPTISILFTSACFALFHYSRDQGLGNIPIIGSLFVLSNFLGYIYEKQGSLLSPIFLHSIFNTLSIINLYFLEP